MQFTRYDRWQLPSTRSVYAPSPFEQHLAYVESINIQQTHIDEQNWYVTDRKSGKTRFKINNKHRSWANHHQQLQLPLPETNKDKKTIKTTTTATTKISEHNNRSVTDARLQPSSTEKSSRHNTNTEEKHSRNTVEHRRGTEQIWPRQEGLNFRWKEQARRWCG
jgi:hypothetical protein